MKNLLFIFLAIVMVSCGGVEQKDYLPEYKEQVLSGKIGGKDWECKIGTITMSKRDTVVNWSFNFSDNGDQETPCGFHNYNSAKAMFSSNKLEKGTTQLRLGFDFSKNQTLTLVYNQDLGKGPMNKIAGTGAYEILEIDTVTNNWIKGRMDVFIDDDNWINGNFTANYCSKKE